MKCVEFRAQLFPYLDGELDEAATGTAAAHVADCADCAGRTAFERALEKRLQTALLADVGALDSVALVAAARRSPPLDSPTPASAVSSGVSSSSTGTSSSTRTGRPGHVLRFLTARRLLAVAAALLIAVQAAWFFCIPPFECSYLQAVERTVDAEGTPLRPGVVGPPLAERIEVTPEVLGYRLEGEATVVDLGLGETANSAVRARYAQNGEVVHVVWSDMGGAEPSFRRKREFDGRSWWVATENGHNLVAWMCPVTESLCTLVSELPEERLLDVADKLRAAER